MRYCIICGGELMNEMHPQLFTCSLCRARYNGAGLAGVDKPELSLFAQLKAAGVAVVPLFPPNKPTPIP